MCIDCIVTDVNQVVITLLCNHMAAVDDIRPEFVAQNYNQYLFDITTPLACPPSQTVNCFAYDINGRKFDLSALAHKTDNYLLYSLDRKDRMYINVCHSLNPVKGIHCTG